METPDLSNYFSFYSLPLAYEIEMSKLKQAYLVKSKLFHPDLFQAEPEMQITAITVSSFNNKAYKVLKNNINRAQYLIDVLNPDVQVKENLPQMFLMEMLDLNETIDEIENDVEKKASITSIIENRKEEIESNIETMAINLDYKNLQIELLKHKYLVRLEERVQLY